MFYDFNPLRLISNPRIIVSTVEVWNNQTTLNAVPQTDLLIAYRTALA